MWHARMIADFKHNYRASKVKEDSVKRLVRTQQSCTIRRLTSSLKEFLKGLQAFNNRKSACIKLI
jgi:hypothetical protein